MARADLSFTTNRAQVARSTPTFSTAEAPHVGLIETRRSIEAVSHLHIGDVKEPWSGQRNHEDGEHKCSERPRKNPE